MAASKPRSAPLLPFSISALLNDQKPPVELLRPPQNFTNLAECFPLIFGANLPFGLAHLLARGDQPKVEEEPNEEDISDEERDEAEKAEQQPNSEDKFEGQIKSETNCQKPCGPLIAEQQQAIEFSLPPGWLFPLPRMPAGTATLLPSSAHQQMPRLPCLPPPFGLLKSSPLLPFFGPFSAAAICGPQQPTAGHQPNGNSHQSQHKRKGGQIRFTNEQTDTLEGTFDRKKYLNNSERKRLAKALTLSERQVKTWFQNRRAKWRRQLPPDSNYLMNPPTPTEGAEEASMSSQMAPMYGGHFCGLPES